MGKRYAEIDDGLRAFVEAQHVFFVATAPSGDGGHVNCSPKGGDTLRVLGPRDVAYVDFVGSGVETIAHLRQNRRIVLMFCALDGPPRIVRLHGRGRAIEPADPEFAPLLARFAPPADGLHVRAIVRVAVTRVADSCGYGVPLYRYEGPREQLAAWGRRKDAVEIETYKRESNATSIDGLAGLGRRSAP
jgi:pyridoxamine 5'-phosphate oxidase-like protein